jgi:hypothetical protein
MNDDSTMAAKKFWPSLSDISKKIIVIHTSFINKNLQSAMPLSTSFDNSLEESNSYLEFKYPQDTRLRLRTTDGKISDHDLTDAGPFFYLEQKFGNVKKCHKISGEKLVFRCEDCNRDFKKEKGLKIHRSRIHGPMSQLFLSKSFSSEINKT